MAEHDQHAKYFVQFYGWYEDIAKDFVFLAMEYVEGGDLSQYLKTPMMRSQAREITRQLLEGLAIMHGRRICHRDIKPQVWSPFDFYSSARMLI